LKSKKPWNKWNKIRIIACIAVMLAMAASIGVYNADAYGVDKPYDIAVTFAGDAQTEKNITWVSKDLSPTQAIVVVREAGSGSQRLFTGGTEIVTGRRDYFADKTLYNGANNLFQYKVNKVTVTGLKPDTRYQYFCGDGNSDNWSDTHTFDTGTAAGDFTFLYMTDPQSATNGQFEIWGKCIDRAYSAFPDAKFLAIAGDLTDRGGTESYWDRFFSYGDKALPNLTIAPAIGNHETDTGPNTFDKHFDFSGNAYGLPGYVYSFDYGDAHFMVLSTEKTYAELNSKDDRIRTLANKFLDDQIAWLRDEVANSHKKWNIVMFHKGLYSGGGHAYSAETLFYRNKFAPVFDELSIDAVLQGHNHTFDRTFLYGGKIVPGVTPESASAVKTSGTVYITANSAGPKFYDASKVKPAYLLKHSQPETQLYTAVTVTGDYLRFDTYAVTVRENDMLYDTFTLYKN